jgi:1,2-dihydroxy-3-keto-5-methylthiopentene dioxygenase
MAQVEFKGKTLTDAKEIKTLLSQFNIPYEHWGVKALSDMSPEGVIKTYAKEVADLKKQRGYETEDIVALDPNMPNLDTLLAKFDKEHHHSDDEVRFTVAGEGVFEVNVTEDERVKITTHPGDLIVIPAWRRHLFYLTDKKSIRCIRLFKDKSGWEAHYPYATEASDEYKQHFVKN